MVCEQCGCSGGLGMGWVSFVRAELFDSDDESWCGAYCPPCAAARFGFRTAAAETYICVWEPLPERNVEAMTERQPRDAQETS